MSFQALLRTAVCVAGLAAAGVVPLLASAKVANLSDGQAREVMSWTQNAITASTELLVLYDRISELGDLADRFLKGEVSRTAASAEFSRLGTMTEAELDRLTSTVRSVANLPGIDHPATLEQALALAEYLENLRREIRQSVGEADDAMQRAMSWESDAKEDLRALFAQKFVARIEAEVRLAELNEKLLHRDNPEKHFYLAAGHTNKAIRSIAQLAADMARNDGEFDRDDPRIQAARDHIVEAKQELANAEDRLMANNRKLMRKAKSEPEETGLASDYGAIFAQSFADERQFIEATKKLVDYTARARPGVGPQIFEAFGEHLPTYLRRRAEAAGERRAIASQADRLLQKRAPPRTLRSKSSIF